MRTEQKAVAFAIRWWRRRGYRVENVSNTRGHNGYDLLARKRSRRYKIEVKGCTRMWQVPDFHQTEVDGRGIVADFLQVVYYLEGRRKAFSCVVPRSKLPRSVFRPLGRFRLASRLKKESALKPCLNPAL